MTGISRQHHQTVNYGEVGGSNLSTVIFLPSGMHLWWGSTLSCTYNTHLSAVQMGKEEESKQHNLFI